MICDIFNDEQLHTHTYIKALLKWWHNASNSQWRSVNM